MPSQFLQFPDDILNGTDIDHEKVSEITSRLLPSPSFTQPGHDSDSTQANASGHSPIPLIITDDRASSASHLTPGMLSQPRHHHHRRALSHDPTRRGISHNLPAVALFQDSTLSTHLSLTPDSHQYQTALQRRGAQRRREPSPLRLRTSSLSSPSSTSTSSSASYFSPLTPASPSQPLEILQPSPRSNHKAARFLEEEGFANEGLCICFK